MPAGSQAGDPGELSRGSSRLGGRRGGTETLLRNQATQIPPPQRWGGVSRGHSALAASPPGWRSLPRESAPMPTPVAKTIPCLADASTDRTGPGAWRAPDGVHAGPAKTCWHEAACEMRSTPRALGPGPGALARTRLAQSASWLLLEGGHQAAAPGAEKPLQRNEPRAWSSVFLSPAPRSLGKQTRAPAKHPTPGSPGAAGRGACGGAGTHREGLQGPCTHSLPYLHARRMHVCVWGGGGGGRDTCVRVQHLHLPAA